MRGKENNMHVRGKNYVYKKCRKELVSEGKTRQRQIHEGKIRRNEHVREKRSLRKNI